MIKIYKLENEDGLIYIGRTKCEYLSSRLAVHKSQALTKRDIKKCTSEQLFRNNKTVKISLLEEVSEEESRKKELEYILKTDCVNVMKSGLDYKETKKNWNDKNPNYANDYYHNNREKLRDRQRAYANTEKGRENSKKRQKKYAKTENGIEMNRKRAERRKVKTICDCGSTISLKSKSQHYRTKKHQKYLSSCNIK